MVEVAVRQDSVGPSFHELVVLEGFVHRLLLVRLGEVLLAELEERREPAVQKVGRIRGRAAVLRLLAVYRAQELPLYSRQHGRARLLRALRRQVGQQVAHLREDQAQVLVPEDLPDKRVAELLRVKVLLHLAGLERVQVLFHAELDLSDVHVLLRDQLRQVEALRLGIVVLRVKLARVWHSSLV